MFKANSNALKNTIVLRSPVNRADSLKQMCLCSDGDVNGALAIRIGVEVSLSLTKEIK